MKFKKLIAALLTGIIICISGFGGTIAFADKAENSPVPGISSGTTDNTPNNPSTGVYLVIIPLVLATGALIAAGVLLMTKKKKK